MKDISQVREQIESQIWGQVWERVNTKLKKDRIDGTN